MRTFDFAMRTIVNLVVGAAILSTIAACGNTTQDRALSGAGIGAAGGAAAGAVTGTSIPDIVDGTGPLTLTMCEFESKVLDDRFRLRYQAPLAAARGQRAQAEMRLSPHTSIQYQWDNENPDVAAGGDHGIDLKLRWEWAD